MAKSYIFRCRSWSAHKKCTWLSKVFSVTPKKMNSINFGNVLKQMNIIFLVKLPYFVNWCYSSFQGVRLCWSHGITEQTHWMLCTKCMSKIDDIMDYMWTLVMPKASEYRFMSTRRRSKPRPWKRSFFIEFELDKCPYIFRDITSFPHALLCITFISFDRITIILWLPY